jgi:hypothetical protein
MAVNETIKRKPSEIPPLTYGIWITGSGWLRSTSGDHYFADPRIEYAKTALRMWKIGDNTPARIELIDESMIGLRDMFLERERQHEITIELNQKRLSFRERLRRWINGILG